MSESKKDRVSRSKTSMAPKKSINKSATKVASQDASAYKAKASRSDASHKAGRAASKPKSKSETLSRPRSGGPKTELGKQVSSMNATRHGLTSARVLADEQEMVETFTQELIDYYKPESPLEVLQIQRIAFCRAKLAKLMDIEIAGRELAKRQLDRHPERVMDQLLGYPQRAKFIALQLIKGEPYLQRLHLDEEKLREIGIEIQNALGSIDSRELFKLAYPKLCAFLMSVKFTGNEPEDLQPDSKLTLLAERIKKVYGEDLPADEKITEIDRMIIMINADEKIDSNMLAAGARTPWQEEYVIIIQKCLSELHNVWQMYRYAKQVIESYHDYKNWNVRALDMTAQDADRLMKYQSMLDKRLSTAIGELLELQRMRKTI